MCCIFGGHNGARESYYQRSEFALKIGMYCVCCIFCFWYSSLLIFILFFAILITFLFLFLVCFFVVWFLGQAAVTTTVLKVTTLFPCKGCNNRIHRAVLKNKVPKCILFLRNPKKPNIQYQSGILKYFLGFWLENQRRNYRRTKPT